MACATEQCPGWTAWTDWTECSVTCGEGQQSRDRRCANGEAGIDCEGASTELRNCTEGKCGEWAPWSDWSTCTVTCGGGEMIRVRNCHGSEPGTGNCFGEVEETDVCAEKDCPAWASWGEWSECSATCGAGEKVKVRSCTDGINGVDCVGDAILTRFCIEKNCPAWIPWSQWSECSTTCGEGTKIRTRFCSEGVAGVDCSGNAIENESCTPKVCPVWSDWGIWSECSETCGDGQRIRIRTCIDGQAGVDCNGEAVESEDCNVKGCAAWADWNDWSDCSVTCGSGEIVRSRVCDGGEAEKDCPGTSTQTQPCDTDACPAWSSWRNWSACSATCGPAERLRIRLCENGVAGVDCDGSEIETEQCVEVTCPYFNDWSNWSECSLTCGEGQRVRSRSCMEGSDCIGESSETDSCNLKDCEQWTEWGSWSKCTATCGGGERTRLRTCENGVAGVGGCRGPELEIGMCGGASAEECPIWSPWSTWSDCSATCGGGRKRQNRICINGHIGDGCGEGDTMEELDCNTHLCPSWTLWGSWSSCSKSCDGGARERSRECLNGYSGDLGCEEDDGVGELDQEICNPQVCPRFGPWSEWSICNATCGGKGIRVHSRECIGGLVGQLGCEGPVSEDQECDGPLCPFWSPWDTWGSCTKPCGGGVRSRGRLCVHGQPGDSGCEGQASLSDICNEESCSYWSDWGSWGACSRTCGNAERFRIRLCIGAEIGEAGCDNGSSSEVEVCPFKPCTGCSPDLELQGLVYGSVACTDRTEIGSICTFACEANYQLLGGQTSTCNEVSSGIAEWSSNPPSCAERCSDAADIVFIIDSSSSIREPNFKIIKSFIKQIVKRFRIGPDAALIGAIRYNFNVSKLWDLKDHSSLEEVLQAIDNIPYDGSGTFTGKAIQFTHDNMFRAEAGRRPGVPKVVVVITDGVSFDDVSRPSTLLKSQGALIVAVGVGNVNIDEINEIASDPDENFATKVERFNSLPLVVSTIADQVKLCQPIDIPDNCPPQALVDLVFIVDSSSSIGEKNFEIIRNFVKDVVLEFNVGYDSAMFGLLLYNRNVDERFQLKDFNTTADVVTAIENMPYQGSGTRTGSALLHAATESFAPKAGRRKGVPKVAIVLTDGRSQDEVSRAAESLKERANVIAIGIAGAIENELRAIASYESNVFITDFQRLGQVMERLKTAVCFATRAGVVELP